MADFSRRSGVFQALAALSSAAAAVALQAEQSTPQMKNMDIESNRPDGGQVRLPNGKIQRDEILKADYEQNVKDAAELVQMATNFQLDLEKSDRFVLSLGLLKKLDEMEKLTKRIRGRMKR